MKGISTLSLTSALDEGGWSTPHPDRFTLGEKGPEPIVWEAGWAPEPVPIVWEAGWAPGPVWTGAENLAPAGILFSSLAVCTLSVPLCHDCPGFSLLSLRYNTHNTSIHALGEIRTRNPSKRSVADLRLIQLGHWDSQDLIPRPSSP